MKREGWIQTSIGWYTAESPELTALYEQPGPFKTALLAALQGRQSERALLQEILQELRELRQQVRQAPIADGRPAADEPSGKLKDKLARLKNL